MPDFEKDDLEKKQPNNFSAKSPLPETESSKGSFTPEVLDKTIIAIPLLRNIKEEDDEIIKCQKEGTDIPPAKYYDVIIDINLNYKGGREKARILLKEMVEQVIVSHPGFPLARINQVKTSVSQQYVFARLTAAMIKSLVRLEDNAAKGESKKEDIYKDKSVRILYRIWPDFKVKSFITKSISTVKADAARSSFSAFGQGITWAVIDSGIDRTHPHFAKHANIPGTYDKDFTVDELEAQAPFNDVFGHGTHVAGILAGEVTEPIIAVVKHRNEDGEVVYEARPEDRISGMAPKCKLVSLKVLDDEGSGLASSLIVAIEYVQETNGFGRNIKIHGVNMSLGYDFDPEWFACGQSPLCVEVDRLVKSGVFVVVAAGNTGYGHVRSAFRDVVALGLPLSINDPGNAELAITVGSTHRDMPHTYGVSYFSSKGPTGDGRLKPDLVAPGEKIISCAAGKRKENAVNSLQGYSDCEYVEDSGTSMAAPHVSGVIAAFLSIRNEYIGKPELVKEIFMNTATDLKRDKYFQGQGLVDLMRAIQSV
ncbi:MAG: S8 family peptidase [Chitinophagaceae bacterium]